jgi:single-stranded-DNA-specific exonuclease
LKLLKSRGWSSENVSDFFSWNLRELPDMSGMKDLDSAAERIIKAIKNNETIGIYGDYDVDGTTSCALLYRFFEMFGKKVELFQPSRFIEGYGVHPSSIEAAIDKDVNLLITVDCGITNVEAAEYARMKDLDLIITDHHKDAAEVMPPAYAVINPNRRDEDKSELSFLAGVGVAFALALKVKTLWEKENETLPSLYPLLQFVAIGTLADLAKLSPMNLKLTRHGLKQLVAPTYKGLLHFIPQEERVGEMIPSEKISFYIGPLINSKGRLDHPERALRLLISDDDTECFESFNHLEISNRERKFIQAEVFSSAKQQVIDSIQDEDLVANVVYSADWHEGVIGIVASKLVETFEVPAIVFTDSEQEGIIKASVRSAGELNIFDALKSCEDLFVKFGGHKSAAGLSMKKELLGEFKERFKNYLLQFPINERTVQTHFDLFIDFDQVTPSLLKQLEKLEPFGMGNARPVFRMKDVKIDSFRILKDQHVKWEFSSKSNPGKKLQGISFFYIGKWNQASPEDIFQNQGDNEITLQFQLGINRFKGKEYLQLLVDKVFMEPL